jgi:hypothetical protein
LVLVLVLDSLSALTRSPLRLPGAADFKIYLPIGFAILGTYCRHLSKKYHYLEPVRTNTCAVHDPVCCFFSVARMKLGGPNLARISRDIARGSRRPSNSPIYLPCAVVECIILFTRDVLLHLRAVPLGPIFGFRDMYTLLPTLCHCILLFEFPKMYDNIEIYYNMRKI